MKAETVQEQLTSISFVYALAHQHPSLPAAAIELSPWTGFDTTTTRVIISLHSERPEPFADFEAWREALGLTPDDVTYRTLRPGLETLRTATVRGGIEVELIAYRKPVNAVTDSRQHDASAAAA
ncbi:hypothetical protein [Streptomyces sp. NBC_01262]|uniref:hypothetical protein n=1 Tax=Streptomyces sp. NBC_01262 TaxID=2903803 RepID=UPI002E3388BA|nr:hypothetical protein [Streptomyces sp. NBC_01262]